MSQLHLQAWHAHCLLHFLQPLILGAFHLPTRPYTKANVAAAAIYEIGAHGDLVAMSPHKSEGPTDTVLFSLDHGLCWHKVTLPEAITVDNIRYAGRKGAGNWGPG
jgi:hypothetical protein